MIKVHYNYFLPWLFQQFESYDFELTLQATLSRIKILNIQKTHRPMYQL